MQSSGHDREACFSHTAISGLSVSAAVSCELAALCAHVPHPQERIIPCTGAAGGLHNDGHGALNGITWSDV